MTDITHYPVKRWKATMEPARELFVYARSEFAAMRVLRKAIKAAPRLGTLVRLEEDTSPWQARLLVDHDAGPSSKKTK